MRAQKLWSLIVYIFYGLLRVKTMRCNTKIQILQRGITEKKAVEVNDDVHQREEKNAYEKILSLKSIH